MKRYILIVGVFMSLFASSCTNKNKKEKWEWNTQIYTPILLRENDTINYQGRTDTFKSGEHFKAKLFRQFQNVADSNGRNMIKEFKGYSFEILMRRDQNPLYSKSWKSMQEYVAQIGDTAFIDIPIDSVIKYSDSLVSWTAGYEHIFFKDNADTTYKIGGKWILNE